MMNSLRKWLYRPKKSDTSLLAQFFYCDEELNLVAAELDSFDGRKDPERCSALVSQLRSSQDKVLNMIQMIMDEAVPGQRASRDFRVKFPDDVVQENLSGQLWFGAECLAAGSSIMNREVESSSMRPLARALTKNLDSLRTMLREQCLKNVNEYTERIKEALIIFDKLFAEFELSYVSAMVPVKTMREYDTIQEMTVLYSETVARAVRLGHLRQEVIDEYDPALMFTIPRLAIVCGLLIYPEGPLNPDNEPWNMSDMFRPFQTLLFKIRELLYTLSKEELFMLEKALCSAEEPEFLSSLESDLNGGKGGQTDRIESSGYQYSCEETMDEPFIIHTPNSGSPVTPTAQKDFVIGTMSNSSSCMTVIERTRHDSADEKDSSEDGEKCDIDVCDRSDNGEDANSSESLHVCAHVIERSASLYGAQDDFDEDIHNLSEHIGASDLPLMRSSLTSLSVFNLCTEIVDSIIDQCIPATDVSSEQTVADDYPCRSSANSEHQTSPVKNKRSKCRKNSRRKAAASACVNFSAGNDSQLMGHNSENSETMGHNSVSSKPTDSNTPEYNCSEVPGDERPVLGDNDIVVSPPSTSRTSNNPSLVIDDSEITTEEFCNEFVTAVEPDNHGSVSAQKCKNASSDVQFGKENRNGSFSGNNPFENMNVKTSGHCDNMESMCIDSLAVPNIHHLHYTESLSTCSSCKSVSSIASDCEWDRESCASSETSSYNSECHDDEEIALAIQAAELASRNEARLRFRSSNDMIHRLFVCISGVADQLQTNFASDLRNILRAVFDLNCSEPLIVIDNKKDLRTGFAANINHSNEDGHSRSHGQQQGHSRTGQQRARQSPEPPEWIPDDMSPNCMACAVPFTFVRRRHHCRNCGKIFCSRCSSNAVPLPHFGQLKPVRVCNLCFMFQVTPFTMATT
ncbi:lateral signaling target protein 2 homolog [Gigantopelta aegis]|uniref:lateral signaling target protein 2 homolog n=1 Tax=Gigantopelta aegis TaxID=1735272 RepID=UPI001B889916|nr:lateral signaling target protein 2 homolog [Gigantopelta aegis]